MFEIWIKNPELAQKGCGKNRRLLRTSLKTFKTRQLISQLKFGVNDFAAAKNRIIRLTRCQVLPQSVTIAVERTFLTVKSATIAVARTLLAVKSATIGVNRTFSARKPRFCVR
jgi:hypothetical protein